MFDSIFEFTYGICLVIKGMKNIVNFIRSLLR